MRFQPKLSKPVLSNTKTQLKPIVQVDQCPSCQRRDFALFEKVVTQGVDLEYVICRWCGLVFLSSRFSDEDLNSFYREEYRKANSGNASPIPFNLEEQSLRGNYLKGIVQSQIKNLRSHLDIGCSAGKLLVAIGSAYPEVRSIGIELSDAYREACIQDGLQVYATIDDLKSSHPERFDLISMSHVLEHIPNPIEFLSMLRTDLLNPQGYLLLEVPNLFGHSSYEITHLICFHEKTIRDVLRLSEYKVTFFKKHGLPRSLEQHERNLTMMAVPLSQPAVRANVRPILWWRFIKLLRFKGLTRYTWPKFIFKVFLKGPRHFITWLKAVME